MHRVFSIDVTDHPGLISNKPPFDIKSGLKTGSRPYGQPGPLPNGGMPPY